MLSSLLSLFSLPSVRDVTWHGRTPINPDDHEGRLAQAREGRDRQPIVPCPAANMIEMLSKDKDASFAITTFLDLPELAMLVQTCSSWKRWIETDRPSIISANNLQLYTSDLELFTRCSWVIRRVDQLRLVTKFRVYQPRDLWSPRLYATKAVLRPLFGATLLTALPWTAARVWLRRVDRWWTECADRVLTRNCLALGLNSSHTALCSMPRLSRLKTLRWSMELWRSPLEDVFVCFSGIGSTLEELVLSFEPIINAHQTREAVMRHVGMLSKLRILSLLRADRHRLDRPRSMYLASAEEVDFRGLLTLRHLHTFQFEWMEPEFYRASPSQCAILARLPALTSLQAGMWDAPAPDSLDEFGRPVPADSAESFVAQRLGVLAAGKGRTIFEDSAVGSIQQEPPIRVHSLQWLYTPTDELVTPLLWSHLCKFVELRELTPLTWSTTMSEEEWSTLGKFTRLQQLCVGGPGLLFDRVLPPLLLCSALKVLLLHQLSLQAQVLPSLIQSLPRLRSLFLTAVAVPSLAPLHNSALHELSISFLIDEHDASACVRRMLAGVSLPRLVLLSIYDNEDARLTVADAADLNRTIFESCPLLLPSQFKQNLRADA